MQMGEIAQRAGLGVGMLYRHFADKQSLRAAIIGRRFEPMTALAQSCNQVADPGEAFEALLRGYLEAVQADTAFRIALLSPTPPQWDAIEEQRKAFSAAVGHIVKRAVADGHLRGDFSATDFILITRGTIANMTDGGGWRRHLDLQLEGVLATKAPFSPASCGGGGPTTVPPLHRT